MYTNWGRANYHSVQAQLTMRPKVGLSFQVSYTWSKNLGTATTFTDPLNRNADYTVLSSDRPHARTSYGTLDLPMGPNKLFFGNTSGLVVRLLENWRPVRCIIKSPRFP